MTGKDFPGRNGWSTGAHPSDPSAPAELFTSKHLLSFVSPELVLHVMMISPCVFLSGHCPPVLLSSPLIQLIFFFAFSFNLEVIFHPLRLACNDSLHVSSSGRALNASTFILFSPQFFARLSLFAPRLPPPQTAPPRLDRFAAVLVTIAPAAVKGEPDGGGGRRRRTADRREPNKKATLLNKVT